MKIKHSDLTLIYPKIIILCIKCVITPERRTKIHNHITTKCYENLPENTFAGVCNTTPRVTHNSILEYCTNIFSEPIFVVSYTYTVVRIRSTTQTPLLSYIRFVCVTTIQPYVKNNKPK